MIQIYLLITKIAYLAFLSAGLDRTLTATGMEVVCIRRPSCNSHRCTSPNCPSPSFSISFRLVCGSSRTPFFLVIELLNKFIQNYNESEFSLSYYSLYPTILLMTDELVENQTLGNDTSRVFLF